MHLFYKDTCPSGVHFYSFFSCCVRICQSVQVTVKYSCKHGTRLLLAGINYITYFSRISSVGTGLVPSLNTSETYLSFSHSHARMKKTSGDSVFPIWIVRQTSSQICLRTINYIRKSTEPIYYCSKDRALNKRRTKCVISDYSAVPVWTTKLQK